MSRKYFVTCRSPNLSGTIDELVRFFETAPLDDNAELVLAPPRDLLDQLSSRLTSRNIAVAADHTTAGLREKFCAQKVKDSGGQWVILGHWDRRQSMGETHEEIAKQVQAALDAGLKVMVCLGENLKQRENLQTRQILYSQMEAISAAIDDQWGSVVLVYQPGWTVDTCKQITPKEVQHVHTDLRLWLSQQVTAQVADTTRITFGGHVNGINVADMAYKANVDGFMVHDDAPAYDFLKVINARQ